MLVLGILVVPVAAAVLTAPQAAQVAVAAGDVITLKSGSNAGIYVYHASDSRNYTDRRRHFRRCPGCFSDGSKIVAPGARSGERLEG